MAPSDLAAALRRTLGVALVVRPQKPTPVKTGGLRAVDSPPVFIAESQLGMSPEAERELATAIRVHGKLPFRFWVDAHPAVGVSQTTKNPNPGVSATSPWWIFQALERVLPDVLEALLAGFESGTLLTEHTNIPVAIGNAVSKASRRAILSYALTAYDYDLKLVVEDLAISDTSGLLRLIRDAGLEGQLEEARRAGKLGRGIRRPKRDGSS